MRWYAATLFAPVETGESDSLENPITDEARAGSAMFRLPPWKPMRDLTEGNPHRFVERTFLTRKPAGDFDGISSFEVGGSRYSLVGVSREGAETMVSGRHSK